MGTIQLPISPEEMRSFLAPENLAQLSLVPATKFVLPNGTNTCCEEIGSVIYMGIRTKSGEIEIHMLVNMADKSVEVKQDQVSIEEWLGLWVCFLNSIIYDMGAVVSDLSNMNF
ncbi:hypothetical protein WA1_50355 [Scytonema hofmannii PCC 7110]|uniref:Uncharacterized protein n=1 Tax=Scytonema hofmannii PCC 7110 TaxID=128403 RepID=A0A139WR74_9CYAN|nr:hypothetical protein [Scytonema hofmannii]KYC34928.1 hypothetical protein WA1_50355 [Scytonema hofmannii PCC 7110]